MDWEFQMPRRTGEEIAKDILSYFLRNPHTADSLEGVARWRLLDETIHRSVIETNLALEWLVQQGYLVKVSTSNSEPIFCLNRESRAKAQAFLVQEEDRKARKGKKGSPRTPES